jgi:hypothetical protein
MALNCYDNHIIRLSYICVKHSYRCAIVSGGNPAAHVNRPILRRARESMDEWTSGARIPLWGPSASRSDEEIGSRGFNPRWRAHLSQSVASRRSEQCSASAPPCAFSASLRDARSGAHRKPWTEVHGYQSLCHSVAHGRCTYRLLAHLCAKRAARSDVAAGTRDA